MKIKRQDLFLMLTQLKPGLAKKEIIEQSRSFLFTSRGVSAFNDEIYAFAPLELPEGLEVAVPSDELLKLLSKLPDDELEISATDGIFSLAGKNRRSTIQGSADIIIPLDSLHDSLDGGKWFKLETHFSEHLRTASLATSHDMNDGQLCYVHVTPEGIEATDRQKACRMVVKTGFKKEVLIEYEAAGFLQDVSPTKCCITDEWAFFRNDAGIVLGCRHRLEDYPDLSPIFKTGKGTTLTMPSNMEDVVERAEIFSKDESGLENIIKLTLKDSKVIVASATSRGSYREIRKVKYDGAVVSFCVNPFLLKELLEHGKQIEVCSDKLTLSINDFSFVISLQDSE